MIDTKKRWLWGALFLLVFQGALAQGSRDARLGGTIAQSALSGPLYADASYLGTHNGERVGYTLSGVGDVNGDGLADFVIGSPHTNPTDPEPDKRDAGAVYLILGKPREDLAYNVSLENADAIFWGKNLYDAVGWDIGVQGDVNGDGYDDILIGASGGQAADNPGHAFLVFGRAAADWGKNFILEDQADASFYGEAPSHLAGQSVGIVGDINGDGYDDFLVGAPKACDLGQDRGKVYLFKGKASGWQRNTALAQADAIFLGVEQDGQAGHSTKGVGDVNGDGVPDFAIGARETPANGRVYLFFGNRQFNWGTHFEVDDADVIFTGEESYSYGFAGGRIAAAGNLNGDNYDDFLISDYRYDQYGGKIYIIFGKTTGGWVDISLSQSDASYIAENRGDGAGIGLGGDFDCNNDGLSDIVVGAPNNTSNGDYSGKAYLIYGKQDGWQKNISLLLNDGYRIGPSADQQMGFAVSGVGDINGDGGGDFVFSATYNDDGGFRDYGKVFLFLGEKAYETVRGSVTYTSGLPVEGVTLSDNGVPQTTTDETAAYSLRLRTGQDHTVTPSKPKGEDVGTSAVSSWDAALAARYSVGLGNLDSQQRQAADVDDDGRVTMYDAVHIARYAVAITAGSSRVGSWVFDPESREYVDLYDLQTDQDYSAMIVGDVDANWSPSMPLAVSQQGVFDFPYWESSCVIEGNLLRITLSLTDRISLISFDTELEYDAEVFEFTGFQKGEMAGDFQVFSSAGEGSVRLGGFRVDPLDEEGVLLVLMFTRRDEAEESGHVRLTRIQLNERLTKENVTLYDSGQSVMVSDFTLYDNYPNPFNSCTTLKFDLQQEDRVRIVVYDRMGRFVREIVNQTLSPGRYCRTWDGTSQNGESVASGVYVITASTSRSMESKKVILVK